MSDFKYIVPPNEPRMVKDISDVGIAPSIPLNINNSALFNASSSSLNRSLSVAGNRRTWTWSGWVKRNRLSVTTSLFFAGQNGPGDTYILFESNDAIATGVFGSGTWTWLHQSSALFRDVSAWYHVVVSWDTTNVVDSERIKLYVNGNRIDRFSTQTFPALNSTGEINNTTYINYIGRDNVPRYSDIYLAEVNFIDGQVLTPSSFGTLSNRTNSWIPIRYTGSYTGNSFYLNFSNSSNLGLDSSGRNNNFTSTSMTQTISTPTNNYATLNFADLGVNTSSLSTGSLAYVNQSGVGNKSTKTLTFPVKTGKWYFEVGVPNGSATSAMNTGSVGVYVGNVAGRNTLIIGEGSDDWAWRYDGNKFNNNSASAFGTAVNSNSDVVMVAFDADTGRLWFGKNNSWFGSGNPAAGLNPAYTVGVGQGNFYIFGIGSQHGASGTAQHNVQIFPSGTFLNFAYSPPIGFNALTAQNIRIPDIRKPSDYFNAIEYNGNSSSGRKIVTGFAPNFLWIKNTTLNANGSSNQMIFDNIRGPSNALQADVSNIEAISSIFLNSIDNDGISLGTATRTNETASSYISYYWKSGRIPGFNIVSYTGDGTNNRGIPHGLGKTPGFIIVKDRDFTSNWDIYHQHGGLTSTEVFGSDGVAASTSRNVSAFGTINPDSTNFYVQNTFTNGRAGDKMIAYCFTDIDGFSRFGAYNGNNSANGPYIYTGFRPRMIIFKCVNNASANNWVLLDTERTDSTYGKNNPVTRVTIPNQYQNDQRNFAFIDFLSNGFKLRMATYEPNASSNLYLFAAFAETPFKYANAR